MTDQTPSPTPDDEPDGEDIDDSAVDEIESGRRIPKWALVAGPLAVIAVVVAVITSNSGSGGPTIEGQFTLTDTENVIGSWDSCSGTGGYSDFGPGMNVTVRDGSGEIIGSSRTRAMTEDDYASDASNDSAEADADNDDEDRASPAEVAETIFDVLGCSVAFEADVSTADFYSIEVGRRGEQNYSYDEMVEKDWTMSLTLG